MNRRVKFEEYNDKLNDIKNSGNNLDMISKYRGKKLSTDVYFYQYIEFYLSDKDISVEWITSCILESEEYELFVCGIKFIDEYYGFENFIEKYFTEDERVLWKSQHKNINVNDIFYALMMWEINHDSDLNLEVLEVKEKWKLGKIRIIDHPKNNDECIFEIEKDDGEVTQVDTW